MRAMSSGDRRDRKGVQVYAESTGPPCFGTKGGFVSASRDCTNTRRRRFARKPALRPVDASAYMKISALPFAYREGEIRDRLAAMQCTRCRRFGIKSRKLIFGVQDDSPVFTLFFDIPRRDGRRNHPHFLAASARYDNFPPSSGHRRIDILLPAPTACGAPPKGIYRLRGSLSGGSHVVLSPGRTSLTSPDIH